MVERGHSEERMTLGLDPDDHCCEHGCSGGACETCACCCAGWCIGGADGEPLASGATLEQQAYWEAVRADVAAGTWYE